MNAVAEKVIVEPAFSRAEDRSMPTMQPVDASPMNMLAVAVQKGMDPDTIKSLMDLRDRYEAGEAKKAYVDAMAAFKANAPTVTKDRANAQYGSRYTSIGNLVNTINAALSEHGLSASWSIDQEKGIKVTCTLTHRLGHSESTSMTGPLDTSGAKNPLQQVKSTVTYLKIATFEAIVGVASSDGNLDDDGNGARGKAKGMDEGAIADYIAAMEEAADLPALQKTFNGAYKAAQSLNDKDAMGTLTRAKDARKTALQKRGGAK